MKVLLLADPNSSHTFKWVKSLSEKGIEIGLFGLVNELKMNYEGLSNVTVNAFQLTGNIQKKRVFQKLTYLKVIPALKAFYKSFQPDIIHAHYASSYGLLGRLLRKHPYLISTWGSDVMEFPLKGGLQKTLLKNNLKAADHILASSSILQQTTEKYTSKKVEIIPFGIDLNHFAPTSYQRRFSSNEFVLGCMKGMEDIYGIPKMIDVFYRLCQSTQRPLRLILMGDGTQINEYRKYCKSLGIQDKVVFTGYLDYDQVPSHYQELDLFLAFSQRESFGVSILEASAMGVPVVANQIEGYTDVMNIEKNGLFVHTSDLENTASQILKLIESPDQLNNYKVNARQWVAQNFDWNQNVNQMIKTYDTWFEKSK